MLYLNFYFFTILILSLVLSFCVLILSKRLRNLRQKILDLKQEKERILFSSLKIRENPLGSLLDPDKRSISLVIDKNGKILQVSDTLLNLLGYNKKQIIGKNIYGTLMPAYSKREPLEMNLIAKIFKNPRLYTEYETELTTKSGKKIWISWTSRLVLDKKGKPVELRCVGFDITPRKEMEEKLQFIASKDPQTDTLNRLSLMEIGTRELKRSIRYNHPFSALALRLLSVDENLPSLQTEKLLQQVVYACRKTIRDTDYIGRIGEAEFILLLPETQEENVPFLQKRLNEKISEYNKQNPKYPIQILFGSSSYTFKTKSIDDLIISALNNIKKRKAK